MPAAIVTVDARNKSGHDSGESGHGLPRIEAACPGSHPRAMIPFVIAGLVPAIHGHRRQTWPWMPGTRPGMTVVVLGDGLAPPRSRTSRIAPARDKLLSSLPGLSRQSTNTTGNHGELLLPPTEARRTVSR